MADTVKGQTQAPDLQNVGGHGLIPVRGDPGTDGPARAPETGGIIRRAPAHKSEGTERRRGSVGKKAFRHPRMKH